MGELEDRLRSEKVECSECKVTLKVRVMNGAKSLFCEKCEVEISLSDFFIEKELKNDVVTTKPYLKRIKEDGKNYGT